MVKKKSRRCYHRVTQGLLPASHPEEIMFLLDADGYHFKVRNILRYLWEHYVAKKLKLKGELK